jgi:quercetin dioxygenase-like cupin family protein
MSIIKEAINQLSNSQHPVAKAFHKGEHFKVLVIAFKKGMALKEHKAHMPSRLVVIEGNVIYKEEGRLVDLKQYDETDIPVEEAKEDSICILTQG